MGIGDWAEELGCDGTVVANALKKAGIEPHENAHNSYKKSVKGVLKMVQKKLLKVLLKLLSGFMTMAIVMPQA